MSSLLPIVSPETSEDEDHIRAICSAVGFLPLAVILVGAYLNKYASDISFADYHEELVKKKVDVINIGKMSKEDIATRHEAAIKATLEDQWKMLEDENARQLFLLAGQFPEAAIIPKARPGSPCRDRSRAVKDRPTRPKGLQPSP
jgi:hypothetical protein